MAVDGPLLYGENFGSYAGVEDLRARFGEIERRLAALEAAKPAAPPEPWEPTIGRMAKTQDGLQAFPGMECDEPLVGGRTIIGWVKDSNGDRQVWTWFSDGRRHHNDDGPSDYDLVADWSEADER